MQLPNNDFRYLFGQTILTFREMIFLSKIEKNYIQIDNCICSDQTNFHFYLGCRYLFIDIPTCCQDQLLQLIYRNIQMTLKK